MLGETLFFRSTRVLRLTEPGKVFEQQARVMLKHWQMTKLMMEGHTESYDGNIRLAVPQVFSDLWIAPYLSAFLEERPGLKIHVTITEQRESIIEKGYDLVVRTGPLPDSNLFARQICKDDLVMVCNEEFIERYGPFSSPEDIPPEKCIVFRGDSIWELQSANHECTITTNARIVTDNPYTLLAQVDSGEGVTLVPEWFAKSETYRDRYTGLFSNYKIKSATDYYCEVNFIYPTRNPSHRVTEFMDMILLKIKNI